MDFTINRVRLFFVLAAGLWFSVLGGCGQMSVSGGSVSCSQMRSQVRQVLTESLKQEDTLLRVHALECWSHLEDPRSGSLICPYLRDPAGAVRFAAAVAIGDLQDMSCREAVERLLGDPDISVQLAAGYALAKLGDTRLTQRVDWYDYVLFGSNPQYAGQGCLLMGKLGAKADSYDGRKKLLQILKTRTDSPTLQLQAAEALARLHEPGVLKKLLTFSNSIYADDRLLAISGLGHLTGPDVTAMLSVLSDDPQMEVRLAAIRALGDLADESRRQNVLEAIHYNDPEADAGSTQRIRNLAILALGRIATEEEASVIYQIMTKNSYSKQNRIAAARAGIDYLQRHCGSTN